MSEEQAAAAAETPIDFTLTHRVTRVSTGAPDPLRIFFNPLGRSLEWNPANAQHHPGSPQDVPAAVARAIETDTGLAPHFRVEPIAPAHEADGPAVESAAAVEGAAERRASPRRRSEPAE